MNYVVPESVETPYGLAEVIKNGRKIRIVSESNIAAIRAMSYVPYRHYVRAGWSPYKAGKTRFVIRLEL